MRGLMGRCGVCNGASWPHAARVTNTCCRPSASPQMLASRCLVRLILWPHPAMFRTPCRLAQQLSLYLSRPARTPLCHATVNPLAPPPRPPNPPQVSVGPDEQAPELLDRLFKLGTQLLLQRLPDVFAGRGQQLATPQVGSTIRRTVLPPVAFGS